MHAHYSTPCATSKLAPIFGITGAGRRTSCEFRSPQRLVAAQTSDRRPSYPLYFLMPSREKEKMNSVQLILHLDPSERVSARLALAVVIADSHEAAADAHMRCHRASWSRR